MSEIHESSEASRMKSGTHQSFSELEEHQVMRVNELRLLLVANFGFMSAAWARKSQPERDTWTRLWISELSPYSDDVVHEAAGRLIREAVKDKIPTVGEMVMWCRTVIRPPAHQEYKPERPKMLPNNSEKARAREATIRAFNRRTNPLLNFNIDYDGDFPYIEVAEAIDLPEITEARRATRFSRESKGFPGWVRAWETLYRLFDEVWAEGPDVWKQTKAASAAQ